MMAIGQNETDASTTSSPHDNDSLRRTIAGVVAGSIVFGSLALMAPFVISKSSLPYMATPKQKIRKALDFSMRHSNRKSTAFVDMGSGDGEAVRQAVMAGYERATGIELNRTLYMISQFRRLLFWHDKSKSKFLCRDLFQYNLSEADTVMIFGVNPLMKRLSQKLAEECRPGTFILSYRFKLPLKETNDAFDETLLDATIVYDKEEMRIYQKKPKL